MARPQGDERAIGKASKAVALHTYDVRAITIKRHPSSSLSDLNAPHATPTDRHIKVKADVEGRPEGQAGETTGKGYG